MSRQKTWFDSAWQNKWWILSIVAVLVAWSTTYIRLREQLPFPGLKPLGYPEHGTVGDAFGPMTALFAMLAFVFTLKTSLDQSKELKLQRDIQLRAEQRAERQEFVSALLRWENGIVGAISLLDAAIEGLVPTEADVEYAKEKIVEGIDAPPPMLLSHKHYGRCNRLCQRTRNFLSDASVEADEGRDSPRARQLRLLADELLETLNAVNHDYEVWVRVRLGYKVVRTNAAKPPEPQEEQGAP